MELKFRRNSDYQDLAGEMTPEKVFMDRRQLLAAGGLYRRGIDPRRPARMLRAAGRGGDAGRRGQPSGARR